MLSKPLSSKIDVASNRLISYYNNNHKLKLSTSVLCNLSNESNRVVQKCDLTNDCTHNIGNHDSKSYAQLGHIFQHNQHSKFSNQIKNVSKCFFSSESGLRRNSSIHALSQATNENLKLFLLIQEYRNTGHFHSKLDPLALPTDKRHVQEYRKHIASDALNYKKFGFTESDLEKSINLSLPHYGGFLSDKNSHMKLGDLINRLNAIYCGTIGIDVSHIENVEVRKFISDFLEQENPHKLSNDEKRDLLTKIAEIELFEMFLGSKFKTAKRFGVEGCESGVAVLSSLCKYITENNGESIVIGMCHRGRLNVLSTILKKPIKEILCEFLSIYPKSSYSNIYTGDVKYHLGYHNTYSDGANTKPLRLNLLPNPSHLETVYPLVLGRSKAQQYYLNDSNHDKVYSIAIHGDASLAGQGVCYETTQMSGLKGYNVGGTIHVVFNNQIGFTTDVEGQSTGNYPSSVGKVIDAPLFHVNADDPESCVLVSKLAFEYRKKFKKDVFINVVGYRRNGHNELDMPDFTQPEMYKSVKKHQSVLSLYSDKLVKEGCLTKEESQAIQSDILNKLNDYYNEAKSALPESLSSKKPFESVWDHLYKNDEVFPDVSTGINIDSLKQLGIESSTIPDSIVLHPTIAKTYKSRVESMKTGKDIDYGLGEALAFASLLNDGYHIRIAGQDAERGTFSHRHCVVHDQSSFTSYTPLEEFSKKRGLKYNFTAHNSPLNEYAAMGYEYGYGLENPNTLSIWEAQFGDFVNGAQIIIDQYLTSGECKWSLQSGLVLLLPHGYDGQGPEHSSSRVERFLQLSNEREDIVNLNAFNNLQRWNDRDFNIFIINASTPANYFHALRRQMKLPMRKPLIVVSPKKMLKMRSAFSRLDDMTEGTEFQRYIPNITQNEKTVNYMKGDKTYPIDESIERLILCSGQVYYDLEAYREKHGLWNVGIARVEQITPFPFDGVVNDLRRYPNLRDLAWVQEEPMNSGPWSFVSKRLMTCLEFNGFPNGITHPLFIGRDASGSPAVGSAVRHNTELNSLLTDAFDIYRRHNSYTEKYQKIVSDMEGSPK